MWKRKESWGIVISLILLGLSYWLDPSRQVVDTEFIPQATLKPESARQEEKHSRHQLRLPTQALPSALKMAEQTFTAPDFAEGGKYAPAPAIAITWDSKCPPEKKLGARKYKELNQLIKKRTGMSAQTQFPRDLHIEQIAQMWKSGTDYIYLGARWDLAKPPTYSLEHYSAANATITGTLTARTVPGLEPGAILDAESTLITMENTLQQAKKEGAQEGSRALTASVALPGPQLGYGVARFLNSTPLEYSEPQFTCHTDLTSHQANCHCDKKDGDSA